MLRPSAPPDVAITIEDEREIKYDDDNDINKYIPLYKYDDDYDIIKYIPLYLGLVKGDLKNVNEFLDQDPAAAYARVSTMGETPMHIAISHGKVELVEELLKRMETISDISDNEKLFVKDGYGDTPFHIAARAANTKISEALVNYKPETEWIVSLSGNPDADEELPLNLAAMYHNWDLLFGLVSRSMEMSRQEPSNSFPNWSMFSEFINCEMFEDANDIGDILDWGSESMKESMNLRDGLYTMAEMVSVFSQPGYFKRLIYYLALLPHRGKDPKISSVGPPAPGESNQEISLRGRMVHFVMKELKVVDEVRKMKKKNTEAHKLLSKMCSPRWTFDSKHVGVYFEAIKIAIKRGNVEFVEEVLRSNPALLWGDKKSGSIFHLAVAWRQEKIWNLIYGLTTEQRNKITGRLVKSNTILHIAACPLVMNDRYIRGGLLSKEDSKNQGEQQSQPNVFSKARDAAMKMQRELQWYEEVEWMVPSSYKLKANNHGETPSDLYSSYHHKLMKEGEKWMRDTSGSFTIVAALIVTVMFAATFTLPGGTDESGNPKFLKYTTFMVYLAADAISLLTSTTSLLMFLSIITSRYIQQSFRWSLHTRLIIGLATLFISIATMMVAFGATLIIELGERISWSTTPITLFSVAASVPAVIFGWLQFPMFVNLVLSTYGQVLFNRRTKCSFYHNLHDPPKPNEP